jgi:molybdate transport system substrate-binding protein
MSGPEPAPLAEFTAPPFDAAEDLCGDLAGAGLRALFAGNQYMVLPELVAGFTAAHPGAGPVFYETLPPGIVIAQLRRGGLRMGLLELRFTPDLIAASPAALADLHDDGLVEEPRWYASNYLTLIVARGNPAQVTGLSDLARPGLRVALPDPATEGIGQLALQALAAAGGEELREQVAGAKQRAGETVLTQIHHRQSPAWLAAGAIDAAFVWQTEAQHHGRLGTPVENVPIGLPACLAGGYAAAVVTAAPHRETAAEFLCYLAGPPGQATYQRHGFTIGHS